MRKGNPLCPTVAPAPATCGGKNRAATDDMTTNADRLWKFGTSARNAKPGNLRVVPVDRERDRRIAEHAEVEGVVGVLPDVVAADDEVLAEGLLQPGVKLVAESGLQRSRYARRAQQQRSKHIIRASLTRQHEVFVERRFQRSRIRKAKNSVGLRDGVGDADARLRLTRNRQTVVKIAADTDVEEPVLERDLVLKRTAPAPSHRYDR